MENDNYDCSIVGAESTEQIDRPLAKDDSDDDIRSEEVDTTVDMNMNNTSNDIQEDDR